MTPQPNRQVAKVRRPVTMAMADELERGGYWRLAEITRKYAVDRPGWFRRWLRGER